MDRGQNGQRGGCQSRMLTKPLNQLTSGVRWSSVNNNVVKLSGASASTHASSLSTPWIPIEVEPCFLSEISIPGGCPWLMCACTVSASLVSPVRRLSMVVKPAHVPELQAVSHNHIVFCLSSCVNLCLCFCARACRSLYRFCCDRTAICDSCDRIA